MKVNFCLRAMLLLWRYDHFTIGSSAFWVTMSNGPVRGWCFEMENHCRYDQLVSCLPKPTIVGASEHATGARPWNSLELTWLAEGISEKQRKLLASGTWLQKEVPILRANPNFKVLNCWTASSSWFPKVKIIHDLFWHIPEFCRPCWMMRLAKNHAWLANLLPFRCVVEAGQGTDCPGLNLVTFLQICSQVGSLRALRVSISPQLPNPEIYSHWCHLPSPHVQTITSFVDPTFKGSLCVSRLPFSQLQLGLPSSFQLL